MANALHLPAKGAIPVNSIPASDLEGINQLLREGRAVIQTISRGGRSAAYVVPVNRESPYPSVDSPQ